MREARVSQNGGPSSVSTAIFPTPYAVEANASALARYSALCQEADLVPIVEPEVLMDGDHDLERPSEVTELVLKNVFVELYEARAA